MDQTHLALWSEYRSLSNNMLESMTMSVFLSQHEIKIQPINFLDAGYDLIVNDAPIYMYHKKNGAANF